MLLIGLIIRIQLLSFVFLIIIIEGSASISQSIGLNVKVDIR